METFFIIQTLIEELFLLKFSLKSRHVNNRIPIAYLILRDSDVEADENFSLVAARGFFITIKIMVIF